MISVIHKELVNRRGLVQYVKSRSGDITVLVNDQYIFTKVGHHPEGGSRFLCKNGNFKLIQMISGKTLLMKDYYTYNKDGSQFCNGGFKWRCSSRVSQKCTAFIVLSLDDMKILRARLGHSHMPPKLKVCANGTYLKC
ncbi:hypothetical protein ACJJTC_012578 [Scirpophaga incertulas]